MSYILDALRKSEQERRNQESPEAFSPTMPNSYHAQENQPTPWIWIAVAVILSVNILGMLFIFKDELFGNRQAITNSVELLPQDIPSSVSSVQSESGIRVRSETGGMIETANTSQRERSNQVQAESAIPDEYKVDRRSLLPSEAISHEKIQVNSLRSDVGSVGFEYSEEDIIRPRKRSQISLAEHESASLDERYYEYEASRSQAKYEVVNLREESADSSGIGKTNLRAQLLEGLEEPSVIRPTSESSRSNSESPAQTNSLSKAQVAELPTVNELPANQQAQIPRIQFSGHLFSSRPESRSIRLGANKYKEGDSLTRTLSLHTITEDGVVFDLNGTLFYISSFEDWVGVE